MPRRNGPNDESAGESQSGARAILRVPQVLIEIASSRSGRSLAELSAHLAIPKASLHRIVRTLETGGYLAHDAGRYRLGPHSFHLASLIGPIVPGRSVIVAARPELERLVEATGETVMLGVLSEDRNEIIYADVIDSREAIRFTIPVGDRRPLYSVASGKAVLAFLPTDEVRAYVENAAFARFTSHTTRKEDVPGLLHVIRASAVAFDEGGRALGASAVASPVFDAEGQPVCAISVAGPSDRIAEQRPAIELLVRKAGERISRIIGYDGAYPPRP